ncbi:hypothetical protein T11_14097 [Trichinella zimbabwensis]|uniref:Uncharacterized protein n=1 Tax=Trichinella zimbabwensis TaxID=268475 RepID=A0A0V1I2W7_9BILA|nr:hypothetical protein T11_14097 [Trichinella zimbabwensis]
MKIESIKRRQQIEQQRLRESILQFLDQLETNFPELAVMNALPALDAQYADAHRAQVTLEDVLPDGEALEAALQEWRELGKELFTTRTRADTFLKEKIMSKVPGVKPALTEKLSFWDQFEVSVDRWGNLGTITKLLHLWSCLSGAVLKAIEEIAVCAENYSEVVRTFHNRFHRVPEVVESHVLKDKAAELTRLHDELNRHFFELRARGKDVDANLRGFHALLLMIKRNHPPETLEAWRSFVQDLMDEQITSVAFLSFLFNQTRIKGSARKMTAQKPERVVCDSSTSLGQNDGNASGNMACVLGVCKKGTVEGSGQNPLLASENSHRRQNRRRAPRTAHSRSARSAAQPDAAAKEKIPAIASAQGSEPEDGTFDRVATELDSVGVHLSSTVQTPGVLLPIVRAMPYRENWKKRLVNCLLGSASEKLLIRTDVANELQLRGTLSVVTVRGVHGLSARTAALATPPIIDRGLRVAGENDPIAVETIFGWILCGLKARRLAGQQETTMDSRVTEDSSSETTEELNLLLRRFWEIDSIRVVQEAAADLDDDAMRKFSELVTSDGTRYVVGLLWRAGAVHLPDNREVALRRLRALKRQLNRDAEKDQEYAGAEEVVGTPGLAGRTWYLPHHAVYQDNQGKMKCRVVFDGSAEWNGTSLNSCLDLGLKLQPGFVAVRLRPEDQDVCRLVWQERGCGAHVKVYQLTRVEFSLTCSPFLAMQVVRHHAQRRGNIDALTDRVLSDIYVDDLAMSCDGVDEA